MKNFKKFTQKYSLIIALIIALIFHHQLSKLSDFVPFMIGIILFISYTRVSISDLKIKKFHIYLLSAQYILSIIAYLVIRPINEILAQGVLVCILTPTAGSAPVISGILGGSISNVATYSFINNLSVAFISPILLSIVGSNNSSFIVSFRDILLKICPIILLPLLLAFATKKVTPSLHKTIQRSQNLSFYIWGISLTIVISIVIDFTINQQISIYNLLLFSFSALIICLLQFFIGRKIGFKFNDVVSGGQSFGQKNTILGIWFVNTFFSPISGLVPGAYVFFQNIVNSYQIWMRYKRKN